MNKLKVAALGIAIVDLTVGGVVAADNDGSCKFKEDGTYVSNQGTISAFGPMNAAMHCATTFNLFIGLVLSGFNLCCLFLHR